MKKILLFILTAAMLAGTLCACSGKDQIVDWHLDQDSHWKLDACGDVTDLKEHDLKNGSCKVCGCEIIDYGEELWVIRHNELGELVRKLVLDAQGNVLTDNHVVYFYDTAGNRVSANHYTAEKLVSSEKYTTVGASGGSRTYCSERVDYLEDGSMYICVLGMDGLPVRESQVDINGTTLFDYDIEYRYDDNGRVVSAGYYSGETLTKEAFYTKKTVDGEDVTYISIVKQYKEDGTAVTTHYDADGNIIAPDEIN